MEKEIEEEIIEEVEKELGLRVMNHEIPLIKTTIQKTKEKLFNDLRELSIEELKDLIENEKRN